jgi:hypothetical protein
MILLAYNSCMEGYIVIFAYIYNISYYEMEQRNLLQLL